MNGVWKVAVACVVLTLSSSLQVRGQSAGCAPCDPDACAPAPSLCTAGLVTDACGCCLVCAKTEGQRCDHPDLPAPAAGEEAGKCGEHLECRLRDDVQQVGVTPEAVCQCRLEGVVCGSDGTSYDNACRLLERAIESQTRITVKSMGPCQSEPVITSPPENVKNTTKGTVTLACEASGFPIPAIEWTFTRVDGKTEFLPSDDPRISVNARGGPERWQATGWLQIWQLSKEHEGDYTCVAQNTLGSATAKARVNVVNEMPVDDKASFEKASLMGVQAKIKERLAAKQRR